MKVERISGETDIPAQKGIQVILGIMHTHLLLSGLYLKNTLNNYSTGY